MDNLSDWTLEPEQMANKPIITSVRTSDGVIHVNIRDESAISYELIRLKEGSMWVETAPF